MPFPVAHGLVGIGLFTAMHREISFTRDGKMMLLCAGLAMLPDIDFLFEWVFNLREAHRGFTHSIVFSVATGLLVANLSVAGNLRNTLSLVFAPLSHAPLDGLVTISDSKGVELFWPLTAHRFSFGLFDYFSGRDPRFDPWIDILIQGLRVSLLELIVIGPFLLLLVLRKHNK